MITFRHPLLLAMPLLVLSGCSMLEDPSYTHWQQSSGQVKPVSDQVGTRATSANASAGNASSAARSGNDKATAPAANSTSVPVGRSAVVPVDSPGVPQMAPTAE